MSLISTRTKVWHLLPCLITLMCLPVTIQAAEGGSAWTCPEEHVYIKCGELHSDLNYYGYPKATYGYGHQVHIEGPYEHQYLNQCGLGKVTRKWKIKYHYETYWCEQTIHIKEGYGGSFDGHHDVWWPKDYHLKSCESSMHPDELPAGHNWPEFKHKGCSKLGLRYKDKAHPYKSHGHGGYGGYGHHHEPCKVIHRTWELIDWCQYDSHHAKTHYGSSPGRWEYIQKIYVYDDYAPEIESCPENIEVSSGDCEGSKMYVEIPKVHATDNCGEVYYAYSRKHLGTDSYHSDYGHSSGGVVYSGNNASGYFEPGQTLVTYKAIDICGNTSTCEFVVTVKAEDTKPPSVLAITSLTVSLVQNDTNDGQIQIWPSEFNTSSHDNCTSEENLKFELEPSVFTCEDFGTNKVKFIVTDEAGNSDFAEVQVIVQANSFDCMGGVVVGSIVSDAGVGVDKVEVTLMDDTRKMTGVDGAFEFDNLPLGRNLHITPYKNTDVREGVDMYDYALVMLHVDGILEITDPFKLLAADVDANGVVDYEDLISLQRVIIGIDKTFPNNTSWRFVSMDYEFPDTMSALELEMPESHFFSFVESRETELAFHGIKIGDVGSLNKEGIGKDGERALVTTDQLIDAQQQIHIPITFEEGTSANTVSFTLDMDASKLEIVEVLEGSLTRKGRLDLTTLGDDGSALAGTWYSIDEESFEPDETLFEIVAKAKQPLVLSSGLSISSTYAPAVTSGQSTGTSDLKLVFKDGDFGLAELLLYQNSPNPFVAETVIGFYMPKTGEADLTILDAKGKSVWQQNGHFEKGYQEITLDRSVLNASGLMFYQLSHNGQTNTKKMIVID